MPPTMALLKSIRDDLSSITSTTEAGTRSNSRIWVAAVVVVGSILLAAALATALLLYFRRREYRRARRDDPALSHEEFLRRRKMTALEREREAELQRRIIIRKSLVSRSTEWSVQSDNRSLDDADGHDRAGLKEDWKEWEARMQQKRPEKAYRHPAATVLPDLPVPTRARPRSTSRGSLLRGQSPS
ncbi:hypothetical protein GE09DRAFT_374456 [Coniochaeta sp. 2T2.1]|nr:hypothetical protein GE09DRAFT_374456 [Coniochaeta sp. 2T2.1]